MFSYTLRLIPFTFSSMYRCPTDRRLLVHQPVACTVSSLHVLQLKPSNSRKISEQNHSVKVDVDSYVATEL